MIISHIDHVCQYPEVRAHETKDSACYSVASNSNCATLTKSNKSKCKLRTMDWEASRDSK